ncbi:hypothetical protein [Streptacidiphilus sp. MAP5-3]|uniref:hypothetical protein n=1 Tax=unclassified Streptacidiphilus TaxID=2643834 RepID=UPI0035158F69
MKLRTTVATAVATAVAAAAAVLALGTAPANAATTAPATQANTALSISASTTHASYNQWVEVNAHLGRTASNRTVEIDLGGSVLKKGTVDRNGNLSAWAKLAHDATFTAKFAGDARDTAVSRSVFVQDAAQVSSRMVQGAYTSGGYTYYHHTQNPTIAAEVSPNKTGEWVEMHIQVWTGSSWQNVSLRTVWFKLVSPSAVAVYLTGVPANTTLREAITFAGDSTNSASNWTWQYAKVVN